MKFSCNKNDLCEAISAATHAVAKKSSFPALEGLLINARNNYIKITGFDLALGIECNVEASITDEGSIVVDCRIFSDIVRKAPSDIITFLVTENNMINIICGLSEFNIMGIDASEFPELFKVNSSTAISIKQPILKSMIRQTKFAISTKDSKPAHTGILFDIDHNILKLVAVDGYKLALRKEVLDNSYENTSFIIPGTTITNILDLLSDDDVDVIIRPSNRHIIFEIENITLVSRLIEGEFINYTNVIPTDCKVSCIVDTKQFIDCIERASLLINESLKGPIRCVFDYDIIKVSTKTQIGNMYDEMHSVINGPTIEFGFNNRYMLDALKACELSLIKIEMTSPLSPIILKPESGDNFLMLVLPIKLKEEN
ncbi:MAG: DNA polymerase III subunit beta [Clostridia bacterium]